MTRWERNPDWAVVDRPDDGEHGGVLYAASLKAGQIHRLEGPAAVVARSSFVDSDLADIRVRTAQALGVEVSDVDEEVVAELLGDFAQLGLVRRTGSGS